MWLEVDALYAHQTRIIGGTIGMSVGAGYTSVCPVYLGITSLDARGTEGISHSQGRR